VSEESKYLYDASLRIMDVPSKHEEITATLGIQPTKCHKAGDINPKINKPWKNSIWAIDSPLPKDVDFNKHLRWIAELIAPHETFLRNLKDQGARMDLYCGYMTDSIHSGFVVDAESLVLPARLGISFGVSVMILPNSRYEKK
jgi:Domain of unknown function (DUF4279)